MIFSFLFSCILQHCKQEDSGNFERKAVTDGVSYILKEQGKNLRFALLIEDNRIYAYFSCWLLQVLYIASSESDFSGDYSEHPELSAFKHLPVLQLLWVSSPPLTEMELFV